MSQNQTRRGLAKRLTMPASALALLAPLVGCGLEAAPPPTPICASANYTVVTIQTLEGATDYRCVPVPTKPRKLRRG